MSKKAIKSKAPAKAKPAAKQAAKQAVVKPAAEAREVQNGVTRPGEGTMCAKVWQALDSLHMTKETITFDAVRALAGKTMADATVRTQIQRWREYSGIKREAKKPASKKKTAAKETAAPAVVSAEVQAPAA